MKSTKRKALKKSTRKLSLPKTGQLELPKRKRGRPPKNASLKIEELVPEVIVPEEKEEETKLDTEAEKDDSKEYNTAQEIADEIHIVQMVNNAKYHNDEDSFVELVDKLSNFFDYMSIKFFIDGFDRNDIYQECMIALKIKAIPDFDEAKGSFLRFAKLCIKRHIITKLKQMKKKKNQPMNEALSIDKEIDEDENGSNSLASYIQSSRINIDEEVTESEYNSYIINELRERLTPLEKMVFELYYEGNSYKEIVDIMRLLTKFSKTDVKVVDNALERIKRKARGLMEHIDNGRIKKKNDDTENDFSYF